MADLPPKDPRDLGPQGKVKQKSIGLPLWMWKALDERAASKGYTASEAVRELVRSWLDESGARSSDAVADRKAKK